VFESRDRSSPRISRRVRVRLIVVDDSVGEDRVDGVVAAGLGGSAGGVGSVADDSDVGGASWEGCGACAAGDVRQDDFRGCFYSD